MLERDGSLVNYQAKLIRKDGTSYDALLNISRVQFGGKDFVQTACIDITERRRMEARLRFLHEHTLRLSSANGLDEIVKYTLDAMKFSLGHDFCDFNVVEGDLLVCRGSTTTGELTSLRFDGRGLVARAARELATVRVGDTSKEPAYFDRAGPEWTGPPTMLSELATPVIIENRVVAVLNVEKAQPNAFSERDQKLLETLASHVGSALNRLKQEEKLRQDSERLRFLHEHALRLGSAKGIDEIVRYTLDAMEFTLGFGLAEFDVIQDGWLHVSERRGMVLSFSKQSMDGPGVTVKAATSKRTIRVSDSRNEDVYMDNEGRSGDEVTHKMLSELAVPVIIGDEVVAVLNVDSPQLNAFSEQDQRLLETLASHVGSALNRLRQEGKLREHSERLEELVEVRTKELRAAERLAAIGELATMVAHDLRNPLQGIATATYNLKKHRGKRIDEVSKEMYQIIDQDIKHSDRILRDLLEYSKEIRLELEETDARATTTSALAHVRIPKRIHIVNSTKSQPKMMADAEKMRRILINLIENAVDAMPRRGNLTIESREFDGGVEITISDDGAGMSKETLGRLWNPLYTTKAQGIGLGLPIAKRLVEAQGGSIAVHSKQGAGSTFTIRMPKISVKIKDGLRSH
jgi:signal transduction histidine kinase